MPVTVTITKNRIGSILGDMRRAAAEVVKETAEQLAEADKQLVPVLTGALRDSIRIEPQDDLHTTVIEGNSEIDYGTYVEFGTRRQVAQPHFTPACEAAKRYFDRELRTIERRIK